jgi:hypothetical protein
VWRVATVEEIIAWVEEHRYVPDLTCQDRIIYDIEPLCNRNGRLPDPTATPAPADDQRE